MKIFRTFGFAALAALTAMVVVGASSAMAENTQLCKTDTALPNATDACPSGNAVTQVHAVSVGKGKILFGPITVECDVLFSSTTVGALAAPQTISGHLTYSSCGGCTVTEVSAIWTTKLLRLGHESADEIDTGEVHIDCPGLNAVYIWDETLGTLRGPLLSTQESGEILAQGQEIEKVSGLFGPATGFLDLTMTWLSQSYLGA